MRGGFVPGGRIYRSEAAEFRGKFNLIRAPHRTVLWINPAQAADCDEPIIAV
jgi:hypothetical protein